VNGALTINENLADNGGLKLSFKAYQHAKSAKASAGHTDAQLLPEYSDDQLFFVAFAQVSTPGYKPRACTPS
jgi:endothelin-converting enzyme